MIFFLYFPNSDNHLSAQRIETFWLPVSQGIYIDGRLSGYMYLKECFTICKGQFWVYFNSYS